MSDLWASFTAEWLKLWKRPSTWVLGVVLVALALTLSYGLVVLAVFLLGARPSATGRLPAGTIDSIKAALYPERFLRTTLSAFSGALGYGNAIALILGVLVTGSEYGWSTLQLVFTQRPGRLSAFGGKLLALAIALGVYTLALLAAGAAASAVLGAAYGHLTPWPDPGAVVRAFGTAWLVMGLWASLGVVLAVLFRQTALAIGLGIVYAVAVDGIVLPTLGIVSSARNVLRGFPGANVTALVALFGANRPQVTIDATQAALVVAGYLVVFVLISAVLLARRDVT
jgi:ABC-type transport system involved in multi-copper enzyme maturation permease subunit